MKDQKIYTLRFWLLCLSSFLFFASFNMLIPELPEFLTQLGGEEYKGYIIGLFTLAAGISRPFSGKIADTVGRVKVMIIGALVCVVLGLLYSFLTTVLGFLLLRFLHGFSTGFKPTGTTAYIADIVPDNRRGEAMGYIGVFSSLGMAFGNAIGSPIVQSTSYNGLFYTSTVLALFSVVILFKLEESLEKPEPFRWKLLKIKQQDVYEPLVISPAVTMALSVFGFGVVLTIIPDFSTYLEIQNKGLFFIYFTISSLVVRILAGKYSDVYGRIPILRIAYFVAGIAFILLGFTDTVFMYSMVAILLGLSVGMSSPTIFAWTIDLCNRTHIGRAMATVFIALELGIGVGALVSAWIYDNNIENFKYAFWSASVMIFIALIFLMFHPSDRDKMKLLREKG